MRHLVSVLYLACLSGASFAQTTGNIPTFEIADVHVAPQTTNRFSFGAALHGTRYEMRNASMLELISEAYGVDGSKVLGGPSWLEMDRYDIIARAPASTPPETLRLMLQSLLADRFKLVIHMEPKPMPAIVLSVGKHLQLKESDGSGEPGCNQQLQGFPTGPGGGDGPVQISQLTMVITCRNVSITSLLDQLPIPQQRDNIRPVVDQTGLKGTWTFELKSGMAQAPGDIKPLSDALDKQLGLKLEEATLPLPVIDVKSVNQKPTPNSPDVAKAFPPPPTEFDVAEIKPYKPENTPAMAGGGAIIIFNGGGGRAMRSGGNEEFKNGRVNLQGYTLKNLISMAWDLNSDEMLVGAPKWMDGNDRFTVIAKVPSGPGADAFIDIDSVKPLLRNLLIERFQMAVHKEDKPVSGFVLSANKPKLKPADPAGRTKWLNGPQPNVKDPRNGNTAVGRLVYCQNMTMAQLAELLPNMAGGYIRGATVLNETALDGAFDFSFYFSGAGVVEGGGRGGRGGGMAAGGGDAASDPSGGISLYDALTKQLGLKLEQQKRPFPVLVIDHVEPKPIEN